MGHWLYGDAWIVHLVIHFAAHAFDHHIEQARFIG